MLASNTGRPTSDGAGSNGGRQEGNRESWTAFSAEMEVVRGDPGFSRSFSAASVEEADPSVDVDELWVREQLMSFVRDALDLS